MDAASPPRTDSSPSIDAETVPSIAAGLSEMAEAVRAADDAAADQSVLATGESVLVPPGQSLVGLIVEPEPPTSSAAARPSGDVFQDMATPNAGVEQFHLDVASPPYTEPSSSIEIEMAHSIAAGFGEMAEAVRAADVASAGPWAQAIAENRAIPAGESFFGQTGELEPPRSSNVAMPMGGIFECLAARDAQGEQFRAAGEFPTTHNRSNETSASQHVSQPAWGD